MRKEGEVEGIKARSVLWYLTFFGFAINYIIRINVPIAIVDMIDLNYRKSNSNNTIVTSECIVKENFSLISEMKNQDKNFTLDKEEKYISIERRLLDKLGIGYDPDGFKWDELEQSKVLGSFFWIHWITQLPGGILAAKYGTKMVFGLTNFVACIMCFIMPLTCYLDIRIMIILRIIQGFITGFSWPAMHHLTGQWIPPNERSKFVSAYLGSSIGTAVAYPLFGLIIKISSWEWVFHSCGIAGAIWYIMWLYFVFDSPEKHPRIHPVEKEYILSSLGSSVMRKGEEKRKTPWKAILTSKYIWLNTIVQWGGIWSLFTMLTQAPTYFRLIHGWGIEMTGILSGFPHLLRVGFSIIFSNFGDYLLRNDKMSRKNVRRLATFVSMILNGICILGLAFSDCNIFLAVFFLTLSLALQGAVSTGALSSMVDIAPNYAGITLGIVSTISIMTGFVSPIMVGYITFGNQSVQAWKKIFEISAGMTLSCGIIYMIFNDTSVQPWNRGYTKVNMENQQVALYEIGEKVEKVKEENDSKDHIEINKLNTVQNN